KKFPCRIIDRGHFYFARRGQSYYAQRGQSRVPEGVKLTRLFHRARFSGKIPQAPRGAEDFSTKPEGPDLARLIRTRTTFACGYGNSASI
ncbi:hypothetical protein EEL35_09550, partial [Muribaculaceae bacterium Isolate-042 (Harlan)]